MKSFVVCCLTPRAAFSCIKLFEKYGNHPPCGRETIMRHFNPSEKSCLRFMPGAKRANWDDLNFYKRQGYPIYYYTNNIEEILLEAGVFDE